MKRRLYLLTALMFALGSSAVRAHGPARVNLTFDQEKQVLRIEFLHKVRNPADHFIYSIRIQRNGEEIVEQSVSRQETGDGGSFLYKIIDAAPGDELKVRLRCNKSGSKTATLRVK
jgi:hypothetical protein